MGKRGSAKFSSEFFALLKTSTCIGVGCGGKISFQVAHFAAAAIASENIYKCMRLFASFVYRRWREIGRANTRECTTFEIAGCGV
jgi:hypothetical protein